MSLQIFDSANGEEDGTAFGKNDWNFDDVPERELEVCRLWEYARESALIRRIRRVTAAFSLRTPAARKGTETVSREPQSAAIRKEFSKLFHRLGRAAILFQQGIYTLDAENPGFESPFPASWMSLPKAARSVLLAVTQWDARKVAGFPGFRRSHPARAAALAHLFEPSNTKDVFEKGDGPKAKALLPGGQKLRKPGPNFLYQGGMEVLLVEIEWARFTNQQLIGEFSQWLKENRPQETPGPSGRGRKQRDVRVSLDRLGMMRLLHRFKLLEMEDACPEGWKAFQGYDWYKERKRAAATFKSLFPFLATSEQPLSWATKGGRSKPA